MKARAIVFPRPHQTEVQEIELPALGANEVRIRTEFSGVSQGTEIWALTDRRQEIQFPTIPGYQAVGYIETLGDNVARTSKYFEGQRVLFRTSRLPDGFPPTWMGTHISHATVTALNKFGAHGDGAPLPIPDSVDAAAASLAALPAVSLRGLEMLQVRIGDLVVVNGQGLIGQSSAQLARLRGATVVVADISAPRLELSRRAGADVTVNVREQSLGEVVRSLRPSGADVVIETTGRSDQFAPTVDLLRWEGQLLMQGWYPDPITFDFNITHGKKPTIAITCGFDEKNCAAILELLQHQKLPLGSLITHQVPVEQAPELYERMAQNDPEILGVVFDWRAV
ncbi:MAG: hypothetical protein JWN98_2567 [Abditibacteriota bacterium]|nr:hypothetical protein [Abditibacteriota bacterium]